VGAIRGNMGLLNRGRGGQGQSGRPKKRKKKFKGPEPWGSNDLKKSLKWSQKEKKGPIFRPRTNVWTNHEAKGKLRTSMDRANHCQKVKGCKKEGDRAGKSSKCLSGTGNSEKTNQSKPVILECRNEKHRKKGEEGGQKTQGPTKGGNIKRSKKKKDRGLGGARRSSTVNLCSPGGSGGSKHSQNDFGTNEKKASVTK